MTERITAISFSPATEECARRGTLGVLSFDIAPIHYSNVHLRRSRDGRIYLSYKHALVRPVSDDARLAIEVAVFTRLHLRPEEIAP
jgi:hypothetical protein